MDAPTVAIVGATGLVGELLLQVLAERRFPIGELRLLASARSAGTTLRFGGQDREILEARAEALDGVDLVFFAATGELSGELAPAAVERGATVIDKSSTWRMNSRVPLVVPEINGAQIPGEPAIIACPNCSTIGLVQALAPLHRAGGLRRVVVTTLQAASGAGRAGIAELRGQIAALVQGAVPPRATVFGAPLADNVVPHCDSFAQDGFTREEQKLREESRKILGLPTLELSATCVRVPVEVGHSAAVLVELEQPLSPETARASLDSQPGVRVIDQPVAARYPTAHEAAGQDGVLVGRVRVDPDDPHRLWLWQVADNLRKGAATNAVQIAEAWWSRRAAGGTA